MNAKSPGSRRISSDLRREDAHEIAPSEHEELPEPSNETPSRATVNKRGRPYASDPRMRVSFRLPKSILARWRASGAGWQTRMAEVLRQHAPD
jgi:uncharacterized protein (DUF4415 family)